MRPSRHQSVFLALVLAAAAYAGNWQFDDMELGAGSSADLRLSASSAETAAGWAEYAKGRLVLQNEGAKFSDAAPYFARALMHLPDSAYLLRMLVGPRLTAKEWEPCLADLAPVVAAHPGAVMPALIYADLLEETGKRDEAIAQLQQTLVVNAWGDGRVVRELAQKLWAAEQHEVAADLYRQALRQESLQDDLLVGCSAAAIWNGYAEILSAAAPAPSWRQRRQRSAWSKRASRQARALARRVETTADAEFRNEDCIMIGRLLADLGEIEALATYMDRLDPRMNSGPARYSWADLRIRLLKKQENSDELRVLFRRLLGEMQLPAPLLLAAGDFFLEQDLLSNAVEAYERLQSAEPDNIGLRLQLAHVYLQADDAQKGLATLAPLRRLPPRGLLLKAYLWRKQGDLERAYADMKKAAEGAQATKDDSFFSTGYYFTLALICETTGRVDEAIELCRLAYQREPDNPACANFLGYLLADHNRELEYACELIDQALAKEPDNIAYLDSRAWVYFRQGRFLEAMMVIAELMQRDVDAYDEDGVIADHAGDIFAANGYQRLAAIYWGLALEKVSGDGARKIRDKMAP